MTTKILRGFNLKKINGHTFIFSNLIKHIFRLLQNNLFSAF